ncbi:uncharacterized protein LOC134821370 isoform X2 [Bolinopsis microptera]|uniref:uncharacterized protein LOC134821370 isoform X2 n=1 Tax=Bolinopsis microptera TaxID=2820187 RepID=UPI003078EBC1
MGETIDNFATFLVIGGAIALISCGVTIAKPNLHGVKFEQGTCRILSSSQRPFWDDLPTCSCGKNCNEEFPCVTVTAEFQHNKSLILENLSDFTGTIHDNHRALDKECLYIPSCSSDFEENANNVYSYFLKSIVPLVNYDVRYPFLQGFNLTEVTYKNTPTFSCWGYDGAIYVDHEYSMEKVYMSLSIPAGCILLGLVISVIFGSSEHRSCFVEVIGLPFVLIAAMFAAIIDVFGCCRCHKPNCRCFGRNSSENRSSIPGTPDFGVRVRNEVDLEDMSRIRRRSVSPSRTIPRRSASLTSVGLPSAPPYATSGTSNPQEVSYPSSLAPPSYNNVRHAAGDYQLNFSSPVSIITDVSPHSSNLPPPPSYDDVVDY